MYYFIYCLCFIHKVLFPIARILSEFLHPHSLLTKAIVHVEAELGYRQRTFIGSAHVDVRWI
jgi:hypothetical protein